ncbi:MAG: hypothetical protein ABEK04_06315 [Candidatus Nanohalobium sp.]
MVVQKIRSLLGIDQHRDRISNIEKRLDRIEDQMARETDVELLRKEFQEVKGREAPDVQKGDKARTTILKLLKEDLEKGEIKERILELDICSESHFYRVWNDLEDAQYIRDGDLAVEVSLDIEN